MIWAALILLAALCTGILLLPTGASRTDQKERHAIDFYHAQIEALNHDLQSGLVSEEETQAARLEIQRRLLKQTKRQSRNDKDNRSASDSPRRFIMILAVFIFSASLGLYYLKGSPRIHSFTSVTKAQSERLVTAGGPTYGEAMTQIEDHLSKQPDDREGWALLGRTAGVMGDFSLAFEAYGRLGNLAPDNQNWRLSQLEALLSLHGGQFSPAARLMLEDMLQEENTHPASFYYLGLFRLQSGDKAGAREIWTRLLVESSTQDAPWKTMVKAQLARLDGVTTPDAGPPRLTQDLVARVQQMSPDEQAAFIDSMIERVRERLRRDPKDAQSWVMLGHTLSQLGRIDEARAILKEAIKAVDAKDRPHIQAVLDKLAESGDP